MDHLLLHLVNGLLWKTNDESGTPRSQSGWKTSWAKKDDKEDQCASRVEDSSNTNQWGKKEAGSSPSSSGKWAAVCVDVHSFLATMYPSHPSMLTGSGSESKVLREANCNIGFCISISINDDGRVCKRKLYIIVNALDIAFINRLFVVAPDGDAKTKMGGPNVSIKNKEKEVKAKHPRVTYADLYQRSTDVDVLATKEALLYIKLIQYVITAKVVLMEAL
ncbi:hypothetical protein Tco_1351925 [Tanacetum coccineum]